MHTTTTLIPCAIPTRNSHHRTVTFDTGTKYVPFSLVLHSIVYITALTLKFRICSSCQTKYVLQNSMKLVHAVLSNITK
jgi:hypothetical protein